MWTGLKGLFILSIYVFDVSSSGDQYISKKKFTSSWYHSTVDAIVNINVGCKQGLNEHKDSFLSGAKQDRYRFLSHLFEEEQRSSKLLINASASTSPRVEIRSAFEPSISCRLPCWIKSWSVNPLLLYNTEWLRHKFSISTLNMKYKGINCHLLRIKSIFELNYWHRTSLTFWMLFLFSFLG